ncbi:MAG: hypothetical protein ABII26_10070 [Pseudomonadota bacterium]
MLKMGTTTKRSKDATLGSFSSRQAWLHLPLAVAILSILRLCFPGCGAAEQGDIPAKSQILEYTSKVPKTILELQQFRQTNSIKIDSAEGKRGIATLINLNPNINVWYLLKISWNGGAQETTYHLENAYPKRHRLLLEESDPYGIVIAEGTKRYACDLWGAKSNLNMDQLKRSKVTYVPLCGGKLFLRNPVKGHRTAIEIVTDFLRDDVRGGERIVSFVRDRFFKDAYRDMAKLVGEAKPDTEGVEKEKTETSPRPAMINQAYAGRLVAPAQLGINLQYPATSGGAMLGSWFPAMDNPGIYISLIQPNVIAEEILQSHKGLVSSLDPVEATSLVYLIAFDLDHFEVGFAIGTEHPRVGWSSHILDKMKDGTIPGPDGIDNITPLVPTGLLNPLNALKTAATFTGGFKRSHGAFMYGDLALKNYGSHYGFIEKGVELSRLQPGLSTLFTLDDGSFHMKTWTESDNEGLARIKHARQNGVPIIEFDENRQSPIPGSLVTQWGPGNWSGSEDRRLRTLRAGAGVQVNHGKRFLIYALFSSATPSAMARVFQGYGCRYAMLLDMNALEHTYLAVYVRQGSNLLVQHLIQGMSEVDRSLGGKYIPRFIGYADNRDFFYLLRRDHRRETP